MDAEFQVGRETVLPDGEGDYSEIARELPFEAGSAWSGSQPSGAQCVYYFADLFFTDRKSLRVRRVANKTFIPANRTVGIIETISPPQAAALLL